MAAAPLPPTPHVASRATACAATRCGSLVVGETVADLKLHREDTVPLCLSGGLGKANYALDCGGSCTAASQRA